MRIQYSLCMGAWHQSPVRGSATWCQLPVRGSATWCQLPVRGSATWYQSPVRGSTANMCTLSLHTPSICVRCHCIHRQYAYAVIAYTANMLTLSCIHRQCVYAVIAYTASMRTLSLHTPPICVRCHCIHRQYAYPVIHRLHLHSTAVDQKPSSICHSPPALALYCCRSEAF